jgi:hypothetical protein
MSKRSLFLTALSAVAFSCLASAAVGCAADAPTTTDPTDDSVALETPGEAIGHEHLMLTSGARAQLEAQYGTPKEGRAVKKLTYYGGPVIKNVNVVPVYWNANTANQTGINAFYSAVTTGQYMTFLSQYSTTSPAQTIGNGSRGAPFVDNQSTANVTDAQVQARLNALFTAGTLPAPNNNNLYMVHFPAGMQITASDGSKSCVQFCAYHGTYVRNSQNVYYGIIPDLGSGGCQSGCGTSTVINNTTSVASHEFAEAVTDPAVGLASVFGPPLAWYNSTYGEIGDICNGQQSSAVLADGKTYTVQKEFSNKTNLCAIP